MFAASLNLRFLNPLHTLLSDRMLGLFQKRLRALVGTCLVLCCDLACAHNLKIYCDEDYPVQFFDKQGQLTGMSIEIVKEIQRRLGVADAIQVVPWARGLDKLDRDPNTMLLTMARTPEREALYQWVGPVVVVEYGLYAKSSSTLQVRNLDDAKKVGLIGVYRNDIRDQTLTRFGFTNLDRAASNVSSFKKLMIGRIDLVADTRLGAERQAVALGYQASDVKLVFPLFKTYLYFGVSKSTDHYVVARWNAVLEGMKKDKTFLKIQKKYLSEPELSQQ